MEFFTKFTKVFPCPAIDSERDSDVVLLTSSFVVVFFLGSSVLGLSSAGFVFVRYELLT